jgi:hypothetical protein
MTNQVIRIAPNHLEVLKQQLSKKSYKKAKKLSASRDCTKMRFNQFLSLI